MYIVLGGIIIVLLVCLYFSRPKRVACECQDVIFYKKGFIGASGHFIRTSSKGTSIEKKPRRVPENIICIRMIGNDLVSLDTNGLLTWRNVKNEKVLNTQQIPADIKHPMWFDYYNDQWWVGDGKLILTLDDKMTPLGYWKAPVPIDKAVWYKDYLYAQTKRGLEILRIKDNAEYAKPVKHIDLTCTGFDIQNKQIICANGKSVTIFNL